jgi:hypothetical protein
VDKLSNIKEQIKLLTSDFKREGINELLIFLDESDFYTAPCSTKFHLNRVGGLAEHTMNVIACALAINLRYNSIYSIESVVIAALCHDFCKINFYIIVDEKPTEAQVTYLRSLLAKNSLAMPAKLNKAYASSLIDFILKKYKGPGTPLPEFFQDYQVADSLPLGHGEKSLYVAQQFIKLTPDEAMAIRWHMAAFDAGIHFKYPSGFAYNEAVKLSKLVSIILLADIEASNLVEV